MCVCVCVCVYIYIRIHIYIYIHIYINIYIYVCIATVPLARTVPKYIPVLAQVYSYTKLTVYYAEDF